MAAAGFFMRVLLLGSGSTGNVAVFETSGARLLVDAGMGPRVCAERMRVLGADLFPRGVTGIVVTHHHADHIAHLEPLARALRAPVYLHSGVSAARVRARYPVRPYPRSGHFAVGPFIVRSEPVPHDAPQVALSVTADGLCFGLVTDLGHATEPVRSLLAECDEALIEANYCPEMLREGPYIPRLKVRVGSDIGHLSNEQTAALVERLHGTRIARVWLGHISQTNNTPARALEVVRARARAVEVQALEHGTARVLEVRRGRKAMTQLRFEFLG
jgi:phosphoribosyl 1,2-cyclic phosphodiesterase